MSYIKKILIVIAMLGLFFCGIKVYDIVQIFNGENTAFNNEEAYVYIPTKSDVYTLQNELFPLLKDEESFRTVAIKLRYSNQVKAGKYTLKKGMSNLEIVRTLQGESDFVKITLPASRRFPLPLIRDIAKDISIEIEASEMEIHKIMTDTLYPKENGYKLSELVDIYDAHTYTIPWNTSAEEFRAIVYKSYEKRKKQ